MPTAPATQTITSTRRPALLWALNYTCQPEIGRTTQVKLFSRMRDALWFADGVNARGYLIRLEDNTSGYHALPTGSAGLKYWLGGFIPSATEAARLHALVGGGMEALAAGAVAAANEAGCA